MKTFLKLSLILLIFSVNGFAKTATIHFTMKNFKGSISIYDPELQYDLAKKRFIELNLNANGLASYAIEINKPTYLVLYSISNINFSWYLFVSPGNDLFLTADFSKKSNQLTVTGKGSNNNQPEIFALTNVATQSFIGDKTPDRVIAALNKQSLLNKSILANYIKVNKPTPAFITNATVNLKYFVPSQYYAFSHNNLFRSKEELKLWHRVQDSLFATVKLSNDEALNAYNYDQLVDNFGMREAEAGKMLYESSPQKFYKQWFRNNTAQGKKVFNGTQTGILNNMVIDKYFSTKTAEYAYAHTIKYKVFKADYPAVISIFNHL